MGEPRAKRWKVAGVNDVVAVRREVRALARQASLGLVSQTKLVTATSELARNALEHAGGGSVTAALVEESGRRGVEVVFDDEGPGIDDVERALTDGYSTGRGLGLGLGGARRLVDLFELDTEPGRGTRIRIVRWGSTGSS